MEEESLLIAPSANPANDKLHTPVVNGTSQSDSLAGGKTIQFHQLLTDDCPLSVVDKCLPLGLGHLNFRHDFSKLAGIDREVSEEVFLVLVNPPEPAKRDYSLNAGHGGDSLL